MKKKKKDFELVTVSEFDKWNDLLKNIPEKAMIKEEDLDSGILTGSTITMPTGGFVIGSGANVSMSGSSFFASGPGVVVGNSNKKKKMVKAKLVP